MSVTDQPSAAKPPPTSALKLLRALSCLRIKSAAALFLFVTLGLFSAHAQISQFGLLSSPARPQSMVWAPDGAYWIAEFGSWRIGRIDTNGNVTEPFYFLSNNAPFRIVVGPDSNLWFTEQTVDKIARISRGTNGSFTNGFVTEFPIHPAAPTNSNPAGLTAGPDGNLWFVEYTGNVIGVMGTNGQLLHEYGAGVIQTNAQLFNITTGPDSNLWFTEVTYGTIGQITTNGVITQFPLIYSNCEPVDIITGPDGAMWFTEFNSNRIGRLTTTGVYSDYVIPTISPYADEYFSQEPYYLAIGGDGNIWFTEYLSGNVSRITPAGFITEFPTPDGLSYPTCIASGPDKNIWFGEYAVNAIGEFLMPTLSITLSTNSQFVLTWPATATDFILQGNTNFNSTNWINLTSPPPVIISNLYVYTNTTTNLDFFRLFQDIIP
jgi:virginiamycin B lyase